VRSPRATTTMPMLVSRRSAEGREPLRAVKIGDHVERSVHQRAHHALRYSEFVTFAPPGLWAAAAYTVASRTSCDDHLSSRHS
jgi:hypothetical protein